MPQVQEVQTQDENEQVEEQTEETTEEATEESEESTEEASEGSEGEGKESKETKPEPQKPRQVFSMPVAKAQEEKKRAAEKAREEAKAEYEAKIESLKNEYEEKLRNATPRQVNDKVKAIAEKHGLEPAAAADLLEAFKESIQLPDTSKYDQILKEKEIESHKTQVSKEFEEKVAPLILKDFPGATTEHIRSVKEKIEELAFTEGYNAYRLEDIYTVNKEAFEFKNGMGAEAPGGRTDIQPFKKLSDEDEIKLADADPARYKDYLRWLRKQESRYL